MTEKTPMARALWDPDYKSTTEERWREDDGIPALEKTMGSKVAWCGHEIFKFKLGKPIYTPDFIHIMEDGRVVVVEVKASRKQRGYRTSRDKLRTAAGLYPFFVWLLAVGKKNGPWDIEFINKKDKTKGDSQ